MALRTPLWHVHASAGARFTEFAGYEMPVHYGSIQGEHLTVRSAVGLFDVSHMSNLALRGPNAGDAIAHVVPQDVRALPSGKGQYTVMLRDDGTILDDLFVFRLDDDEWFVIPNAGRGKDVAARLREAGAGRDEAVLADETDEWAILALQGPDAKKVLAAVDVTPPKFHHITTARIGDVECRVSGTGYTGEKGVEVYAPAAGAPVVWHALLVAGERFGIRPIGLGARDTLRLEKGYCLAGNEFAGGRTPIEANLAWLIDWDHDFAGRDALARQQGADHDVLLGLVQARGVPRTGYAVARVDGAAGGAPGAPVGVVTSGTMSPSLAKGIGLAYLRGVAAGDTVAVDVRGRPHEAIVAAPPFV
jgi:aminomethyltransferase